VGLRKLCHCKNLSKSNKERLCLDNLSFLVELSKQIKLRFDLSDCCTLAGLNSKSRSRGHSPFVQAGAETSDTDAHVVEPDPRCSSGSHAFQEGGWVGAAVVDENAEFRSVLQPLRITLVIRPVRRTYVVVVVRCTDELLRGEHKWVSEFEMACIRTRWTDEC